MKTSLWIIIVLVSGLVGFLVGYSVSSHTGTRALEAVEAAEEKAAAHPPQAPAAHAMPAGGAAEKPAAPAAAYGSPSPEKPAAPTAAAGGASPPKPAAPKKVAGRRAAEKGSGSTAGY